ncbi:MAG: SDR family NAD(P)-dependent oxidoreductase [Nostoc sp.]|uniref:SDR family NAD(P)-dependent oxidoreductase n=1 Tax=Nostoc sp. TaxID=1180 RepID=UPI002FF44C3B
MIEHYPETAKAVRLDVTLPQDIQAAVDTAIATFSRIDVLVNNVGHGLIAALEEVSDVDIHRFFETNFFGAFRLMRMVLPVMRHQSSGHIVNMSSTAGLVGFGGSSLYCGAKFALEGTSEALTKEVESFGVKVTLIESGAFRTDFNGRSLAAAEQSIDAYAPNGTKKSPKAMWFKQSAIVFVIHAGVWSSRGKLLGDVKGLVIHEPIPLIIFVLKSLSFLRTENEKLRFSSTFYEKKLGFFE